MQVFLRKIKDKYAAGDRQDIRYCFQKYIHQIHMKNYTITTATLLTGKKTQPTLEKPPKKYYNNMVVVGKSQQTERWQNGDVFERKTF